MLARNAESLFWIGRYVERADDTARILDVSVHQLLEDSTVDPDDRTCRDRCSACSGSPRPRTMSSTRRSLTDLVAFSARPPGSIVDSISHARENARGAREVVSTEMWECLNTTYNALAERQREAKRVGPHEFFRYVEDRARDVRGPGRLHAEP